MVEEGGGEKGRGWGREKGEREREREVNGGRVKGEREKGTSTSHGRDAGRGCYSNMPQTYH